MAALLQHIPWELLLPGSRAAVTSSRQLWLRAMWQDLGQGRAWSRREGEAGRDRQEDEAVRGMKREGTEARQGDETDTGMRRKGMQQEGQETGRG